MNNIFKRILLLWFVFFTQFIYADKDTTYIHISNVSANEATGKMTFTVTIDALPLSITSPVRVGFETIDGTAKVDDNDYTAKDSADISTLAVWFFSNSASTSKTIEIDILDDAIYESSEYFYLKITTNTNGYAISGTGIATGTIIDDDVQPLELNTFNDKGITETDSNQTIYMVANFNQNTPTPLTLTYHTQDNSALAGDDYIGITDTITVPANVDRVLIPVTIKGDYTPESTKDFKVIIDSISEGTATDKEATVTIYDDDAIEVDVTCADANEGNNGETNNIECRIYLTKDFPIGSTAFSVDYTSQDGSAPSAIAGNDYTAVSGTVTFKEGVSEHIVNIPTIGDDIIEPDENVKLVLSNSPFIIDFDSEAEILNDDGDFPGVDFSTGDVSILEGNTSTKTLSFHFELDKVALAGSSFEYYTQDDDANVSDNDYVEINTTLYTIPVGTKNIDIDVIINGDTKIENDETFYLKFQNEKNISISGHTAKGHILNDDGDFPSIKFDVASYEEDEGDANQTIINVLMTLDKPALANSRLDYYTFDSSAKLSNNDYVETTYYKHYFSGGETNLTVPLIINGDTDVELNEYFYFKIATVADSNITIDGTEYLRITILNDDGNFSNFSIEAPTLVFDEKDSNQTRVDFTIRLDTPAKEDNLSIEYLTSNGSAEQEDLDYNQIVPTVATFNTGEQSKVFSAYINGDTNIEPDESFFIKLQNPKNATLASAPNNQIEITITNDDAHNELPFTCDESMYISSSIKRGSGSKGKMWLHKIDTTQNPFGFNVVDDSGETKLYNALAYSDSGDANSTNYIFGLYKKELVKISRTGKVISLGKVAGLPKILTKKQLFAGAIYNGEYYISGPGQDYDKIFKIKLSDKTVTELTLDTAISLLDFSFTPDGKYLHGIVDGGKMVKIDVNTGAVTFIGSAHTGYQFDSTFSDANGRFFANDSLGNGFFEFDLTTGNKRFLSDSQPATFNDGANCLKASLVFTDYGDAPISYGPVWHNIANGIFLGDNIDHDLDSYDTVDADGDDINGVDDDDGVTLSDGSDINGTYFDTNATHTIKVKLSKEAYLKVWIDKEINGHFSDSDDLIYNSGTKLSAGEHTISFDLPANLTTNTKTYLRARVSSNPSMNSTGFVTDGEVEDYMIYFGKGVQPLRGVFNIERTNSGSFPIDSQARNAWFTQIVGRDFDYSLLFYEKDMSQEKILDNVTVKVELIDEDTNSTLYTKYAYIKNSPPKSRIDNALPHDLDTLPATKRARFRIYYGVDGDNNIIQAPCTNNPEDCFNALPQIEFTDSKDDFSIRPDYFHMIIFDGNSSCRVNTATDNNTPLRVSAGYDYNLSLTASIFNGSDATPSKGYNPTGVSRVLEFLDKSNSHAPIKNDYNSTDSFKDGKNINTLLEIKEVGNYRLNIIDNKWTQVDSIKGDCDINSSIPSANGNIKSGCNITSPDINLSSYPDYFDINLTMQNLPNSTHNDFIYMSEINSTYNSVALSYQGSIIAKNEDNETTQNFTNGYFSQDVELKLNASTLSDGGVDTNITSSDGSTVNFARTIEFNSDGNITTTLNPKLSNLSIININADKFTRENNGTANIDIRYNIDKNLSKTINPIQITFHSFEANSTNSYSISHGKETPTYIPNGILNLGDRVRNFYYAKVTPDRFNYPRVYTTISRVIRTPLSVDIFCDVNNSYCTTTGVINNSLLTGTTREQNGWYISTKHNENIDGNVTNLIDNPTGTVLLTPNPTPLTPLTLPHGHNGMESAKFINCNNQKVKVTIITDPVLAYKDNKYILNCTDNNASQWTGIGKTGNVLEVKPKVNKAGKMEW